MNEQIITLKITKKELDDILDCLNGNPDPDLAALTTIVKKLKNQEKEQKYRKKQEIRFMWNSKLK